MKYKLILIILLIFIGQELNSQVPPGSYQRSCHYWRMRGETLVACCANVPQNCDFGNETSLPNARSCKGDIENRFGQLRCTKW